MKEISCLLWLLRSPLSAVDLLSLQQWDLIVRQARCVGMLGRIYHLLDTKKLINRVPNEARRHFRWGNTVASRHAELVRVEVESIADLVSNLGESITLLKGAAYCCSDNPAVRGRLFTDIDILVEKGALADVERILELNGWLSTHLSDYDQNYYRRWMHELPPMKHGQRQTELDIHHAILPETARVKTDSRELLSNVVAINARNTIFRLSDEDMLLHSAAHLFFDGEFKHGFRDLEDIRSLLEARNPDIVHWNLLLDRALTLGLSEPCYFALYFSRYWFEVEISDRVLNRALEVSSLGVCRSAVLVRLFSQSLMPVHPSCSSIRNAFARQLLYIRSHFLKMPVHLLVPHLVYKAVLPLLEKIQSKGKQGSKGGVLQMLEEDAKSL